MKATKILLFGALLQACLMLTSAWAAPTVSQADAVARKALEQKQYESVLSAYSGVDPQSLNDQSFYRLAIARQKLNQSIDAHMALSAALLLNPKGTFASSPERLAALKEDILKGAAGATNKDAPASMADVTASKTALDLPVEVQGNQATPVLPVAATATEATASNIASGRITDSSTGLPVAPRTPAQANIWDELDTPQTVFLIAMCLLLVVFLIQRMFLESKVKPKTAKGIEELVALRESVKRAKLLIEMAGNKDTDLYKALNKMEPILIMEIGRMSYRKTHDENELVSADQDLLQALSKLKNAPLPLDGAEPEKLMQYVFGSNGRFKDSLGVVETPVQAHLHEAPPAFAPFGCVVH